MLFCLNLIITEFMEDKILQCLRTVSKRWGIFQAEDEANTEYMMENGHIIDRQFPSVFAFTTPDPVNEGKVSEGKFLINATVFLLLGYGHITPQTPLGQGTTVIFCIFGIPITMLALKTTGELLANAIKYLVLKTETVILKRAEPKHVKKKTFFVASTLMVVLLISTGASAVYFENWTFIEGLYAWFTTFTTIGFGDYVMFESLARNIDRGKTYEDKYVFENLVLFIPYIVGLSLTSCLLNCVVDSIDEIRDFRDRYMNCWPSLISFARRLLGHKNPSYDAGEEQTNTQEIS